VALTAGGTCVTGAGTTFNSFFVNGDIIRAPAGTGQPRTIQKVVDDQHLITFSVLPDPGPPSIPPGTGYEKVGVKTTLDRFKSQNGFTADDASAVYFNAGDLGFGRSMHMWKSGGNIAYYVSNYFNVEAARLGANVIATVAMDFSPNPLGGPSYTKFYVFNAAGARVNNANLDGRGQKFVPRLCVICHAGTYAAPTSLNHGNMGSRFIAFDLSSYLYSGFVSSFSRASQEEAFRKLNQGVLENTNPSTAAQELINGWYTHDGQTIDTVNQTVKDSFVASGWAGHEALYTDVVRTSCRTCHVNRDKPLDWAKFSGGNLVFDYSNTGFKQNGPIINPYVCEQRIMPHSKVTYIEFWTSQSPDRVTELRNAGLDDFLSTDPCPLE
jgi:hypothetical protein